MKYFLILLASLTLSQGSINTPVYLSVADEIAGEYEGRLQDPSLSSPITDHKITITKIDDTTVKIAPSSGNNSVTFEAKVEKANGIITIKANSDLLPNNGTYAPTVNRLSYMYHLGGSEQRNVQVFVGTRLP